MLKIATGGLLVILAFARTNAISMTGADGELYRVSEWSKSESFPLMAANGQVPAVHRSCIATNRNNEYKVDLIFSPDLGIFWIGSGYTNFFVSSKTICGVKMYSSAILFRRMGSPVRQSEVDASAALALTKFLDTNSNLSSAGATDSFSLDWIFGFDALNPRHTAMGDALVSITGLEFHGSKIAFSFESIPFWNIEAVRLQLTFSSDLDVIDAAKNGKVIPVLQEGRYPWALSRWGPLHEISLIFDRRMTNAFSIRGDFSKEINKGSEKSDLRAVVLTDGRLWIGSSQCMLAATSNRITGLFVRRSTKDLLVFTGPRSTVPTVKWTAKAFRLELQKFEEGVVSGRFKENEVINLPALFPEDASLRDDPDLQVTAVTFRDGKLIVFIRTNSPQKEIELTLSAENKPEKWTR